MALEGLYFSKEHEWVRPEGDVAYVGITDHAQSELGDLVYVDCGEMGATVSAGDAVAVVESVKAASDVYTPVSGEIVALGEELADAPEKLNEAPYEYYLFAVKMSDPDELACLMDETAYLAYIKE